MTLPPLEGPIAVLHVEDDLHDRELSSATLAADGLVCDIRYVDDRETFESELLHRTFDVILADYNLPRFDGLTAQAIARRLAPATPFIYVSGTLGEELAIERMKDGAVDYVLKHRLQRLPSAVRRAISESRERLQRQRAEQQLRELHAELRARAERSDALIQALFEYSPMGIAVRSLDGRLLLASPRAGAILGRPHEELVGRQLSDVAPERLAAIYETHDALVVRTRQPQNFEEPFAGPGGLGVLAAHRFPLMDAAGQVYAIGCLMEDVTERKRQDDELRLARVEAERANHAKSTFLSHISHDLRTPLNAILGFAQLLESDDLPAGALESVRQISAGGRHLLELIDEVLDITRIEAGHLGLAPEPIAVADAIDRTVSLVRPLAAQRGITIEVEAPPEGAAVVADPQRFRQILINLLSNAVKYNREGGRVSVRYRAQPEGQRARIAVEDTGAGIPADKLGLLFRPFERLGAEHTATEGTGLGLALSKALAEAMNGTLLVESAVGRGSTFWIELPISEAVVSRPESSLPSALPHRPSAGVILYVEDNPANAKLMERIVARRPGVTLVQVAHGRDVPAAVAAHRPGLILLDLHLPDITGDTLLERLNLQPDTRDIPKVMVTADATPGLVARLRAAGAVACITKPLNVDGLLRLIDELLEPRPLEQA